MKFPLCTLIIFASLLSAGLIKNSFSNEIKLVKPVTCDTPIQGKSIAPPDFSAALTQSGFVRKFYEVHKNGTSIGQIDRIFVTGVSPITLDSLISGFNIASHISLSSDLQAMLGFTQGRGRYPCQ